MTEQTKPIDQKVLSAKDNGRGRQWGLGRLFVQLEGAKQRINTRATFYVVGGCFFLTGLIGVMRPVKLTTSEKNPISTSLNIGGGEKISIDDYHPENDGAQSSKGAGPSSKKTGVGGLDIVRRNQNMKVPPGSLAKAKLLSGASNGFVKAVLTENVVLNGETILKSGTTLLGSAQSSKERLMISFRVAVFADGSTSEVQAQACDPNDKMPGLSGVNVRGQALNLAGAVGLNFAGGVALGMQDRHQEDPNQPPSTRDALLNGAAVAALERAKDISQDMKSTEPLLEVEEGTEFYVLFLGGS